MVGILTSEKFKELYSEIVRGDKLALDSYMAEKLYILVVEHAIECVRDVLREEYSGLSYKGADSVQDRLRDYFQVPNEATHEA